MKTSTWITILFTLLLLPMAGCEQGEVAKQVSLTERSATPAQPAADDEEVLKFGFDLRLGPKEDVRIYLPFLRYIERETGRKFALRFTKGYEDTVENLGTGVIQFAALGPVNYVLAKERYGAGCLAMGLNSDGKAEYRGVIFTRVDSPINSIEKLAGKNFAFGDRFSTQGHIIPRRMFEEAGLTLADLGSHVFTGSHANTARAVLNGEYEVGGMQDTLARRLAEEGKIRILATSSPCPSSMLVYSKDVDPETLQAVRAAVLAFDPQGKNAVELVDWDKTEMPNGFTEPDESALERMRSSIIRYGLLQ